MASNWNRERDQPKSKALRAERIAAGDCMRCGHPRGEDGTRTMCRGCAHKCVRYQRKHQGKPLDAESRSIAARGTTKKATLMLTHENHAFLKKSARKNKCSRSVILNRAITWYRVSGAAGDE